MSLLPYVAVTGPPPSEGVHVAYPPLPPPVGALAHASSSTRERTSA
jgi:hypothetical protein